MLDLLQGEFPATWKTATPAPASSLAEEAAKDPAGALARATREACGAVAPDRGPLAYAMTEAQGGSDLSASATRIVEKEGTLRIDGEKTYVVGGASAEEILVWGLEGEGKILVPSAVRVPRITAGVTIDPVPAPPGMDGLAVARVRFSNVRVGSENRLGAAGEGMRPAETLFAHGHRATVEMAEGIAASACARLCSLVAGRTAFGKPIADHLPVAEGIAEIADLAETLRAVRALLSEDDPSLAAVAKAEATDRLAATLGEILPLGGGAGLSGDPSRFLLAAQTLRLAFGGNGTLRLYAVHRALPSEAARRPASWLASFFSRPRLLLAHASLAPVRAAAEEGVLLLSGRGRTVRSYYGSNLLSAGLETDRIGRLAGEVLFLSAQGLAADHCLAAEGTDAARRARAAVAASRSAFARMLRLSRDLYDFDDAGTLETARAAMKE